MLGGGGGGEIEGKENVVVFCNFASFFFCLSVIVLVFHSVSCSICLFIVLSVTYHLMLSSQQMPFIVLNNVSCLSFFFFFFFFFFTKS